MTGGSSEGRDVGICETSKIAFSCVTGVGVGIDIDSSHEGAVTVQTYLEGEGVDTAATARGSYSLAMCEQYMQTYHSSRFK